jgi:hypothetical protein
MNSCDSSIGEVSAEYCIRRLREKSDERGVIHQAVAFLNNRSDMACVKGDVAVVALNGNIEIDVPLIVSEVAFHEYSLSFDEGAADYRNLQFSYCFFNRVYIDPGVESDKLPLFNGCMFERVSGRISIEDMPKSKFNVNCEYSGFDVSGSSVAIRSGQSNTPEKVLLITLRKLYVQSLSGRAESALYRGLDVDERRFVSDVLRVLKRYGLATDYSKGDGVIWLPIRKELERVKRILHAPAECSEQVVLEARRL